MAEDIPVALVGFGMSGSTFHAPLITKTPGLVLQTIVSGRPSHVEAHLPGVRVVPKLEEALADPAIALVVIATPDPLHAPQAMAALEAGKHVVIDKPFATSLAEARALAARAEETGRLLSVFHNRRWDSDFLTLQQLLSEGALGEVMQFESHFDRFRPTVRDRWREREGGGVWKDLGPHLIDQALGLFGQPIALFADIGAQRHGARTDDYFHVLLRYPTTRVLLHGSMMTPASGLRLAVHGTGGSFVKHGLDPQEDALKAGERPDRSGWGRDPDAGTLTPVAEGAAGEPRLIEGVSGAYPRYYTALRDALRGAGPNPVSPTEALAVMEVLERGWKSAAERREVRMDEAL